MSMPHVSSSGRSVFQGLAILAVCISVSSHRREKSSRVASLHNEILASGNFEARAATQHKQEPWYGIAPEPTTVKADDLTFGQTLLRAVKGLPYKMTHESAMPVLFGLGILSVFMCAVLDYRTHTRADPERADPESDIQTRSSLGAPSGSQDTGFPPVLPERSLLVIITLTSYRFFTGFLGATWVPYLIVKEGNSLFSHEVQLLSTASFMGICKLIYGFSICLNPFFGLVSDKLAATAPWGGRQAFFLAGVALAAIGIFAVSSASYKGDVLWYILSSCLWMLGEAMADIASETIAPEMLPPSQYDLASSVRSMHLLVGALAGYIVLISTAAASVAEFRWLYVVYLAVMLLCALPTVACMRSLRVASWTPATRTHTGPMFSSLFEAYIGPTRFAGGFPRICLCQFIFSLGTGPIFFTLLMLHDLVGLESEQAQQLHFCGISIVFLFAACITAVWSGMSDTNSVKDSEQQKSRIKKKVSGDGDGAGGGGDASSDSSDAEGDQPAAASTARGAADAGGDAGAGPARAPPINPGEKVPYSAHRWSMMFWSAVAFGVACCAIPAVSLFKTADQRVAAFYVVGGLLGLAFGSVSSRIQACTWSLLPASCEIANAMGFATIARLGGVGLGNLMAGLVLDSFRTTVGSNGQNYSAIGYMVMNWTSALCVFISAALVLSIARKRRQLLFSSRNWFCLC